MSLSTTGNMVDEVIYCTVQGIRQTDFFQGREDQNVNYKRARRMFTGFPPQEALTLCKDSTIHQGFL